MWVTASLPRGATRPFVIVVFPLAESPTTPRMMGRAMCASILVVEESETYRPPRDAGVRVRSAAAACRADVPRARARRAAGPFPVAPAGPPRDRTRARRRPATARG